MFFFFFFNFVIKSSHKAQIPTFLIGVSFSLKVVITKLEIKFKTQTKLPPKTENKV